MTSAIIHSDTSDDRMIAHTLVFMCNNLNCECLLY